MMAATESCGQVENWRKAWRGIRTIQHQAIPADPLEGLGEKLGEASRLLRRISSSELGRLNVLAEG